MSADPNTITDVDDTSEAHTFNWLRLQAELDPVHAKYKHLQRRVGYKTAARKWEHLDNWTPEGLERMYAKIEEDLDARDQRRKEVTAARQRRHVARLKGDGANRKLVTIPLTRDDQVELHAVVMEVFFDLGCPRPVPWPELRSAAVSRLLTVYNNAKIAQYLRGEDMSALLTPRK